MEIKNLVQLSELAEKDGLSLGRAAIRLEAAEQQVTEEEIERELIRRAEIMKRSVATGLEGMKTASGLVGDQGRRMRGYLGQTKCLASPLYAKAMAYALAANECNAGMGVIVAAPTAGASGVLPALVCAMEEEMSVTGTKLAEALAAAGAVGAVIARNASLSGAEGGCQAECGSAAAMAAAAAVEMLGGSREQALQAAAMALQGMLGLVCDPVAGLVEIPCVHRNAGAVTQALMAADMAMAGVTFAIPVDEVIEVMGKIGRVLPVALRETALGGLAASPTGRAIAERVLGKDSQC
ncbi:MAG: L-serine ammonia-lyase, iron-sulfur-dependent, subunit alpha [Negativicutes bacterium]|nr:L-serine ammonia-lyase, iron-sulfur-dependent, subunit alpha [Negativicutes bacterium]